jgi:hypothetical protein
MARPSRRLTFSDLRATQSLNKRYPGTWLRRTVTWPSGTAPAKRDANYGPQEQKSRAPTDVTCQIRAVGSNQKFLKAPADTFARLRAAIIPSEVINDLRIFLSHLSRLTISLVSFSLKLGKILARTCWALLRFIISGVSLRVVTNLIAASFVMGIVIIVVFLFRNPGTIVDFFIGVMKAAGNRIIKPQRDQLKHIWDHVYCKTWPSSQGCPNTSNSSIAAFDSPARGSKFTFELEKFVNGGSVNL